MKKCFYAVLAVLALSSCAKDIEPGDEYYTDKDCVGFERECLASTASTVTFFVNPSVKGVNVKSVGVCCSSTSENPTLKDSFGMCDGISGEVTISGLEAGTLYYWRPFLRTSDDDVYYGWTDAVETGAPIPDVGLVISKDDEEPSDMTAYGGEVEIWIESGLEHFNASNYTEFGVVHSLSHNPTVNDTKVPYLYGFDGDDGYSVYITMSKGEVRYYRGYAIKKDGTVIYSDDEGIIQTVAITGSYDITSAETGSFYLENGKGPYSYRVSLYTRYEYYGTSSAKELGFVVAGNSYYWLDNASEPDTSEGSRTSDDTFVFNNYADYFTYYAYAVLNDDTILYGEVKYAHFSL